MSQLRHDPLSGRDVIVAAGRAARPTTFAAASTDDRVGVGECPFCPGNEAETPPEVARTGTGEPDRPGWTIRAFPNLYPIVDSHEVVVLAPDHRSFAELTDDEAVAVVTVLRDRVHTHLAAGRAYGLATINHLRAAGASIAHPHAQLFAFDEVPTAVAGAVQRVRDAGGDLVSADAGDQELAVTQGNGVTVWCPPAPWCPYLLRVAHDDAGTRFDTADDTVTAAVARATRDALARLQQAIGDVPYNLIVYTAPRDATPYHWYVEIVPRLTVPAGFEQATGIFVNTVPPEQAAETLRGVVVA